MINRIFRVRVGDTLSPSFDQIEGVSQGSVLNVLCLTLAINDSITAIPNGFSCSLYIDDFVSYVSGSTLPSAFRRMQLPLMAFIFLWRNLTLSFSVVLDVYFWNLSLPSMIVLYLWFVRSISSA